MNEQELERRLREGFTDDYIRDFGTLLCYIRESLGESYCPACEQPCNKHTGHRECRETYNKPLEQ